jgi:hypothetical protein
MIVTVVAVLFIGALLRMSPDRLRVTLHDEQRDLALSAAKAGVQYALNRLTADPSWRGQGSGVTAQTENLVVREDYGNVFGWVRTSEGPWAAFRFRFNYQDGTGGPDGLPQPEHLIDTPAISLNNLNHSGPLELPLGTGPNWSFEGQGGFMVPAHSVALLVEGLVSDGLDPGQPIASSNGPATRRSVEGVYQIGDFPEGGVDGAVLMSGADAKFVVGKPPQSGEVDKGDQEYRGVLRLMAQDQVARIRAKGEADLASNLQVEPEFTFFPDIGAEVADNDGAFSAPTKSGQEFSAEREETDDPFLEVAWDEVATSEQPDRITLPAGVYAFQQGTGGDVASHVSYYPMSFSAYRARLNAGTKPTAAPLPASFSSLVTLASGGGRHRVTLDRDVDVSAVGSTGSLAIVPASGARQWDATVTDPLYVQGSSDSLTPENLEVVFAPKEVSGATLRAKGSVMIGAKVSGEGGGIVSDGIINLVGVGERAGDKDVQQVGLSLYASKDINISTYDKTSGDYQDFELAGVIFAKENLLVRMGEPKADLDWGVFDFLGTAIVTGRASTVIVPPKAPGGGETPGLLTGSGDGEGTQSGGESGGGAGGGGGTGGGNGGWEQETVPGYAHFTARGVRLCYEPRFLLPSIEDTQARNPVFRAVSQTVR